MEAVIPHCNVAVSSEAKAANQVRLQREVLSRNVLLRFDKHAQHREFCRVVSRLWSHGVGLKEAFTIAKSAFDL